MNKRQRSRTAGRVGQRHVRSKQQSFENAQFLQIDLDVRSRRSLAALVAAWPSCYEPLIREKRPRPGWLILNAGVVRTAESAAKKLLRQIRALRGDALLCWTHADTRVFDIGVRAGGPGKAFEDVQLTQETLRQIADAGATVQVTVYPAEPLSPRRGSRVSGQ
jgi:hypothetical protein